MQLDIDGMGPADRYELVLSTIVPSPIALITTLGPDGVINASVQPFQCHGSRPAIVVVSVLPHPEGRFKDTANNIFATKEFVVNLVSESVADA